MMGRTSRICTVPKRKPPPRQRTSAALRRAQAERDAGIPDRPAETDVRETLYLDLTTWGGPYLRIQPRPMHISARVTDMETQSVQQVAIKTLLHRIADQLPRTLGRRARS